MLISDYFSWLILGKILVCFLWGCPGAYVYHSGLAYINTPSLVLYGSKNRLITCERFALLDSRIPMWGVQLTALRPFYRMTRLGNNVRRQCQMNTLKRQRVEFFVVLGHFCPLTLLTTQKIKILKKKKKHLEILSFYTCVSQMMIIWCMVPEISSTTDEFFVISDYVLPFYPPYNPENQNFEKNEKTPGVPKMKIILPFYTPSPLPNNPENEILKKNTWRYHHFP